MRPAKLSIQGMTAYRQNVEVDFSDLDLFAITGETGAGKSSLVDAISFALFGQAPRVGTRVRELISQGEDRLKVSLEFSSNGERYRIHRSTARKGQPAVQLERADDAAEDGWERLADRATDATSRIEAILQMDYEAFVRSVLLPQGQFQEFLAGDRDQRRKVLDRLLDLEIYERMARRANAIASEGEREAERISERLRDELSDATPEALKAAKAELKALQAKAKDLASLREATEAACRTAEKLAEARTRHASAQKASAETADRLKRARQLMSGGQKSLETAAARVAEVQKAIKAADYNADLHLQLARCLPLLGEIERAAQSETKLVQDIEKAQASLHQLKAEEQSAAAKYAEAQAASKSRHDDYEAARHLNAAALLRSGLAKGDPCPVCGQAVATLPPSEKAAALDKLREAWEKAQSAEKTTRDKHAAAERALHSANESLKGLELRLQEARTHQAARRKELAEALPDPALDEKSIAVQVTALEKAKEQLESLKAEEQKAIAELERTEAEIAAARGDVTTLEAEAKVHAAEAEDAAKVVSEAEGALKSAVSSWPDAAAALADGRDAAPALKRQLSDVQSRERDALQAIGAAGKHIEQTEANIELARRLRGEEKSHRDGARLAKDLASLLRIDALPSFIREEALRRLAEDGSHRLNEISNGRYEFAVEGQDFLIVDRWNGGESRSVRTLSGGETFLASLALALALAEQLPALGRHGGGRNALDSLFIDEGFSHLDEDTLNTVASALEVLGQDRRRLIGVITHVPALAERMPARITVHKSQTGSTVTVE